MRDVSEPAFVATLGIWSWLLSDEAERLPSENIVRIVQLTRDVYRELAQWDAEIEARRIRRIA